MHRAAHQLALEDEDNIAVWVAAQDQLQSLQEQIERIYGDAQVQLGVAAPSPEMGGIDPGASKVRVRHDLKPWDLATSATPSEFRRWKRKFKQYFLGSDLGVTQLPGQQVALLPWTENWNNISTTTSATIPRSSPQNPMKTSSCPVWTISATGSRNVTPWTQDEGNLWSSIPIESWIWPNAT